MEKRTLLNLVAESQSLVLNIIENDGVLSPELEQQLAQLQIDIPEKVDGYAFMMDFFGEQSEFWKAKAQVFLNVSRTCANTKENLKDRMKYVMQEMNINEIRGVDMRFKLSNSKPKLIIDDSEMVPVKFKTEVISTEINKKMIEDCIKGGEAIPGAHLESSFSLRSYANTKQLE